MIPLMLIRKVAVPFSLIEVALAFWQCFLSNLLVIHQTSNFKPIIGKLHKCFM